MDGTDYRVLSRAPSEIGLRRALTRVEPLRRPVLQSPGGGRAWRIDSATRR
jgi:hypothetical protein